MWYFKTMLWVWHVIGIIGLLVSRDNMGNTMFSAGIVIVTLGFLGIIYAIEGGDDAQDQTSEVGEIKEI